MKAELTPIDVRTVPELARLVEEVVTTRRPRPIVRGDVEIAVLVPASKSARRRSTRRREGTPVTDRTAGALKDYRLPQPLSPEEEKGAFERGVAEQVVESQGG